ncbi:MAG TPA: D-2-hydroxyacid dehydrogenase [Anaerolineales bacterium]|nr:D-2-hydroxyacid dehydrogenase [Anaerolineales bacterium]
MPKLLILTDESKEYLDLIQKADLPNLEIVTDPKECDIVLGEPRKIQETLPLLTHLKWVQSIYAGVERLVHPANRRDYILTNARGVFGPSMSEFVFGYILFFKKRIRPRVLAQRARKWDNEDGGILRGKTLGLLGVGSIGAHLASTAKHFGMQVRGFTNSSEDCKEVDEYFHAQSPLSPRERAEGEGENDGLLEFANGLDYLISVLPRTENTNQIVNTELFNALPSHAIFINVGRGNAVDNSALVDALNRNQIAAAVLDVTDPEPLPEDHPFWATDNLYLTFHTSAMSYPEDMVKIFVENYPLYLEGRPLKYRVDFERGY